MGSVWLGRGLPSVTPQELTVLWAGQVDGGARGGGAECHEECHLPPKAPDARAHPHGTFKVSSMASLGAGLEPGWHS